MEEILDLNQPQRWRTWSRETPHFWCMYRTDTGGSFSPRDRKEFSECQGKYLIYFDHTRDRDAKEFALKLIERYRNIVAAKVSVYAINGEKILVLLAKDNSLHRMIADYCATVQFFLWRVASVDEPVNYDSEARLRDGEYKTYLAKAFKKQ